MTFKHIKFNESPIMRSLEKVAIDKGTFEPDSPIVKEASGESFDPSNDLFGDMVRLANGLRKKGFVSEAEKLEDKIFAHKMAKKDDGEKMMDDAHPEGDVEVAPSKGGYGKMLTHPETQRQLLDIVNKKPTGKYASIVKAVEEALGITKIAQDWLRHTKYSANIGHIQGMRDLAKTEINRIQTLPLLARPPVYFDGKADLDGEEATRLFVNKLKDLYIDKNNAGIDIEKYHWKFINHMKDNIKIINKRIPYTLAAWANNMDLDTMFSNAKANAASPKKEEAKLTPAPAVPTVGSVTISELVQEVIQPLSSISVDLMSFSKRPGIKAKADVSQYARQQSQKLRNVADKLNDRFKSKSTFPYSEVQEALTKINAFFAKSNWSLLTSAVRGQRKSLRAFMNDPDKFMRRVTGDNKLDLLKKLSQLPEVEEGGEEGTQMGAGMHDVQKDPGAPQRGLSSATKKMQQSLLSLAAALEKYDPKRAGQISSLKMAPYRDDGMWGGTTNKALDTAEVLRAEFKVAGSIRKRMTAGDANANITLIDAITKALGEGPEKKEAEELGTIDVGSQELKLTNVDMSSLSALQRKLEETGTLSSFLTTASLSSLFLKKAQAKPIGAVSNPNDPNKPFMAYDAKQLAGYKPTGKSLSHPDPSGRPGAPPIQVPLYEYVRTAPAASKVEPSGRMGAGLTFQEWYNVLAHIGSKAIEKWKDNAYREMAAQYGKLVGKTKDRFKDLKNLAEQQGAMKDGVPDPNKIIDVSQLLRPSAIPGKPGLFSAPGPGGTTNIYIMGPGGRLVPYGAGAARRGPSEGREFQLGMSAGQYGDEPPIGNVLDLHRPFWRINPRTTLVYTEFSYTDAEFMAGQLFSRRFRGNTVKQITAYQEWLIDLGAEIARISEDYIRRLSPKVRSKMAQQISSDVRDWRYALKNHFEQTKDWIRGDKR